MNHIFVDYENIKSVDPAIFGIEKATFTLVLGPQNRALDVSLIELMLTRAAAVELIRLSEAGRNAVDFALVYYLGRKVASDSASHFHLISKDTGYDPLIEHLRSRHLRVRRHEDFAALLLAVKKIGTATPSRMAEPSPGKAAAPATENPFARVLLYLRRNAGNRPKRKATLVRQLSSQVLREFRSRRSST